MTEAGAATETMSISTRTGDEGTTGIMFNRRVAKCHPRVEAVGAVDELNAALGFACVHLADERGRQRLQDVQGELIALMGEMAALPEDLERYLAGGPPRVTSEHVARLDAWVKELEGPGGRAGGWATPGGTASAATLDLARTTCRRAERRASAVLLEGPRQNPALLAYLNRLADVLWLMARREQAGAARGAGGG